MIKKFAWGAFAAAVAFSFVTPQTASAQSAQDLINDGSDPTSILTYGMGYGQTRHSAMNAINLDNVSRLRPEWTYSLADSRGQETFPMIHDGKMYVTTHAATMALDLATGMQVWKTIVEYPAETPRVACCGIVNRGVALYEGKVFRTTLDAHVVALDAATGAEVWRTKSIDFKDGYSMTVAPLIADGVLITGISGGEYGIRGYIEGYDPNTGERLWRTYTIPAPGEPGSETWKDGGDAWKRGGGPAWLTGSYDAELNTVYWGTGNPSSWNAGLRPGDNLYASSILALDPKTGAMKWHYQTTPNDPFDYDTTNELVHAEIDGRKVIMQANRNGFFYILDRETGELVAAPKFIDKVNWADSIDLTTGRPVETEVATKARAGEEVNYWPSALGGKNWSPMAYNPNTNTVFANTNVFGMNYKAVEPQYRPGVFYFGAEFSWDWPEGDRGELRAFDPVTGELKWKDGVAIPRYSGVLSTDGGLVFTGNMTGDFEAFNAETGEKVWSYNTGSGIVGQPVTWERDGKQYVTIANGVGAVYTLFSGDERLASVPTGGNIWTFSVVE
ncbi:MAG: PQQ-dependent dehydrogenase, methanol/ethanol family [Sulfitobacter sp.]|nr:PQQ-dependent dehydrogenase, methanol/ethanol family [Sulfitobacter sp.]